MRAASIFQLQERTADCSSRPTARHPSGSLLNKVARRIHRGGRTVGKYYGDESLPTRDVFFDSDGGEVFFEFRQFIEGMHEWRAYTNTIEDKSEGDNHRYVMRGAGATTVLEFGPKIEAMRPPATPHGYLWVGGKAKCKNILVGSVQTSYAYAWTTLTNDPNGPKLSVPKVSVWFKYDEFPQGPITNTATNTSQVEASEQIRRAPGKCSAYKVVATGVGPDGVAYAPQVMRVEP